MAFHMPIGCVRRARYCGNMYSRHLFSYGGLLDVILFRGKSMSKNRSTWEGVDSKNSCRQGLLVMDSSPDTLIDRSEQ